MNIYNFLFLLMIFSYLIINILSQRLRWDKKKIFLIWIGIIFVLFSTVRDNSVSIDLHLYLDLFEATRNHSISNIVMDAFNFNHLFMTDIFNGFYEAGFILFIKIIYTFFDYDIAFKLFTSLFINIPILWFIYKYSKNEVVSVLIYFLFGYYTQSYVIIRQYMALAILLIALHFLLQNNIKKYFLIVFIAMFFHKTSACFLIVYFVKKYWGRIYENILKIIGFIILLFFVSEPLIMWGIKKFYPFYIDKVVSGEGISLLVLLSLILVVPFFLKTIKKEDISNFDFSIVLFFMGVLLQVFTYNFSLLNRLALYFQFFIVVFIPNHIRLKRHNKGFYVLIIICFFVFFNLVVLRDTSSQVNKYKFMDEIIYYGY